MGKNIKMYNYVIYIWKLSVVRIGSQGTFDASRRNEPRFARSFLPCENLKMGTVRLYLGKWVVF